MTFDPQAATRAMIDGLGPAALARSQAYTTGGHWLMLGGLVVAAVVTAIIVRSRLLDRVDVRLARRRPVVRNFAVIALYFVVSALINLPWSIYTDWWRERSYGRTGQSLGDFLGQGAISLAISVVLGALFFLGVYALIRRTGARWWLWSGGFAAVALALFLLVSPTLIEPLFNTYKPVPDGPVKAALEIQAKQAGIDPGRIFLFDGSRQSNNFTANVSGLGSAARIAISDVALKQASLDEVRAVTGHEIGQYVLHHVWWMVGVLALVAMAFFFLADRLFAPIARAFGSDAKLEEARGIPVLLFAVSLLSLLAQPVVNTLIRMNESAADRYSLETVNLPDALATALVKTAEYRYPRPGALEEVLFYNHPSVERRVLRAMEWKAAHPATETPPVAR
jgi:STE24 endopeptidase